MSNWYNGVRSIPDPEMRRRCAERLVAMRTTLAPLRAKRKDSSILLATWNIRDLGADKFNPAGRLDESFYYLAEVASCFDLIALQEVNDDLTDFDRLVRILGGNWDYLLTDTTEGTGGNGERMAFLFNRDKVWFRHIAGEIVLPKGQLVVPAAAVAPPAERTPAEAALVPDLPPTEAEAMEGQQFARTPFLVAFQAGWFRFNLCTVHIYYGEDSGVALRRRIAEIRALVSFFAKRQDRESRGKTPQLAENYILLGDFNVVSPEHETMAALTAKKFRVPEPIDGTNFPNRNHFYDQIAVRVKDPRFRVADGGMLDLYQDVFTDDDLPLYAHLVPPKPVRKSELERYRTWRTWQMSDHSPLWVEIATDFSDDYLRELAAAT
ncbi:endonuclease/exonuclease/phosphatase family protein [Agromyces arachidis]|uniref:endonuclease/exonuclease/phosphatase family protein n=1 Tax=Agromyces arachidis TaxID=766966 RepID=UPI0040577F5F